MGQDNKIMRRIDTYGNTFQLNNGFPICEIHRNAIYLPMADGVPWEGNPNWGMYDVDGRLIEAAAYYRGVGKNLIGQAENHSLDGIPLEYLPYGRYLYGGNLITHYGHFLLSTLSRYWMGLDSDLSSYKIVCHGQGTVDTWWSHRYVRDIFAAIGLAKENFIVLKRPAKFREITIPRPACEEHNFVHKCFSSWGNAVGNALIRDANIYEETRPVWLAKTKIKQGVQGIVNEIDLVSELERRGVEIVHPQELSLTEQVILFATRPCIMGSSSSAFHTSILSRPHSKLVCLSLQPQINSNFGLIDAANNNNVKYFHPDVEKANLEGEGGNRFNAGYYLLDPKKVSDVLLEEANS